MRIFGAAVGDSGPYIPYCNTAHDSGLIFMLFSILQTIRRFLFGTEFAAKRMECKRGTKQGSRECISGNARRRCSEASSMKFSGGDKWKRRRFPTEIATNSSFLIPG